VPTDDEMTISVADRQAAMQRVLVRLAELCGDSRNRWFGPADLISATPFRATVDELEQAGLVKRIAFDSDPTV